MADSIKIPLTRSQQSDLFDFSAIGSADLSKWLGIVREKWKTAMSPQDLTESLKQAFPNLLKADAVVRLLIGLRLVGIQSNFSPDQIALAVFEGLEADRIPLGFMEESDKLVPLLNLYLSDPAVRRVAMVVNLSYEYPNLLRSARIISDIRPIYNDTVTDIEASVVSYTLRLRYSNSDGECDASIALDHADVLQLADQCDRAIRKSIIAKAMMNNKGIRTAISGDTQTD